MNKCLHCDKDANNPRGLCAGHYQLAGRLAKEFSWEKLVEKKVCLRSMREDRSFSNNKMRKMLEE